MKLYSKNKVRAGVMILLAMLVEAALAMDPPTAPPDIVIVNPPNFVPPPLGDSVIPPFNASFPGTVTLEEGQGARLMIVTNLADNVSIQWFKDGQLIPSTDGDTLNLSSVSVSDAGNYRVEISSNGSILTSSDIEFSVDEEPMIEDAFRAWLSQFFDSQALEDLSLTGPSADPDHDGIRNLAEYAFGQNPSVANKSANIQLREEGGTTVSIAYNRARELNDLLVTYEGSSGLGDWVPLAVLAITVDPIDASSESVDIDLVWPFQTPNSKFVRVGFRQIDP